jgi:hypothetical protein
MEFVQFVRESSKRAAILMASEANAALPSV